jgi:hypothetical protein
MYAASLLLLFAVSDPQFEVRTWTSANGKYTVDARMISGDTNMVKLRESNGTIVDIPFDKLSVEDQTFVRSTQITPASTGVDNPTAPSTPDSKPQAKKKRARKKLTDAGGMGATSSSADKPADSPKKNPTEPSDKTAQKPTDSLPDNNGYYDLAKELTNAGYSYPTQIAIEQYVRFGSAETASHALLDQFSEIEAERANETARQAISKRTYIFKDRPVDVPRRNDFEEKGLFISSDVNLALEGTTDRDMKYYSGKMMHVTIVKVNDRAGWYLTKDKQLIPCHNQEEMAEVIRNEGYLYYPFGRSHSLFINLGSDLSLAKDLSQNRSQYTVDVILRDLQYQRISELGYYQRKALQENDLDCSLLEDLTGLRAKTDIPLVFHPDTPYEKLPKMVTATLVAVRVKKDGKVIGSYDDSKHN